MKTEAELRQLHADLKEQLEYTARLGIPVDMVRELVLAKLQLEWILHIETPASDDWAATLRRGIDALSTIKHRSEAKRRAALQ